MVRGQWVYGIQPIATVNLQYKYRNPLLVFGGIATWLQDINGREYESFGLNLYFLYKSSL